MPRAALQDFATLKQHGYLVEQADSGLGPTGGWTLRHVPSDDECGPDYRGYLMIGDHGCTSPTQWEAVAEGLKRIEDDTRVRS